MQKWEYKTIIRIRTLEQIKNPEEPNMNNSTGVFVFSGAAWELWVEDYQKELPPPVNMITKLHELGNEGWELVEIITRSSSVNTPASVMNISGFTTDEEWVFKRPIES